MKKIFILFGLLPLASAAFAQSSHMVTGSSPAFANPFVNEMNKTTAGQDTLNQYFLNVQGYTIYNVTGGYLFGTSYDGFGGAAIEATGLHFDSVGTNVNVIGVYGWFARKHIIGSPDVLKCELYEAGADSMPTTLLAFGNASMAFIDTNVSINFSTLLGFQFFQLNQGTPIVNSDFFIGINNTAFDDTLGFVSTVQGDGLGQKRCRQLTGAGLGGQWVRAWDFWTLGGNPLDADPVLFPIVQFADSTVGASHAFSTQGLHLYPVAPNPVVADPVIHYTLDQPEKMQLWVIDASGKYVYDSGVLNLGAGEYSIELDRAKLASGTYFYTAKTNKTSISSRFVIP